MSRFPTREDSAHQGGCSYWFETVNSIKIQQLVPSKRLLKALRQKDGIRTTKKMCQVGFGLALKVKIKNA